MKKAKLLVSAALLGLCAALSSAHATPISSADSAQLEAWLGSGPVSFTEIFQKTAGATAQDFHQAADGKGATVVILNVSQNGVTKTIGGYNPKSWDSLSGYVNNVSGGPSYGFIFNLSDGKKFDEHANDCCQTYNYFAYGPTFGGGHDIYTNYDLTSGYSYLYSYAPVGGTGNSIVDGSPFFSVGGFVINSLDVYTITAVPEPETYGMLLAGLGAIGLLGRRKKGA